MANEVEQSPIMSKLLERRQTIAKLPLKQQQQLWKAVYGMELRPRFEQARASGAQVEPDDVARERFVTAMTGGEQKTTDFDVSKSATGLDKVLATLGAAGAGVAGSVANVVEFLGAKAPMLRGVESNYEQFREVAPTAAPIAAGVGKTIPFVAGFETGAGLVPSVAKGAPLLPRVAQWAGRTIAGSAGALPTQTMEGSVSETFTRDVATMAIFDGLIRGVAFTGKTAPKAASSVKSWFTTKGATQSQSALLELSSEAKQVIGELYPDKLDAITKGAPAIRSAKTPNGALTVEEMTTVLSEANKRATAAEAATKHNARVEKLASTSAEKEAEKLSKIASAETERANRAAKALQLKAFQKELAAYRKATGQAPPQGSQAWNALLAGAKAQDLVPAQAAVETAKKVGTSEAKAVRDIVEEQPAIASVVDALGGMPEAPITVPSRGLGQVATQQEVLEHLAQRKEGTTRGILLWQQEQFDKLKVVLDDPNLFRTHGSGPSEGQTRIREVVGAGMSAEEIVAHVKQGTSVQSMLNEMVERRKALLPASPVSKIPKAPRSPALQTFGITVDTSRWTTPEDVVKGKASLMEQLKSVAMQKANEVKQAVANKTLTKAQADALNAQLSDQLLKAAGSINKIKTPEISPKVRDRLRNAAKVSATQAQAKAEQKVAEQTGRAVGSNVPSEEDAFLKIDELVKKGFRLIGQEPKAKEILKAADKEGLDNASKLELLQEAFDELTKRK